MVSVIVFGLILFCLYLGVIIISFVDLISYLMGFKGIFDVIEVISFIFDLYIILIDNVVRVIVMEFEWKIENLVIIV